jgi:hypothetical protein
MACEMTVRVGDDVAVAYSACDGPELMSDYLGASFFDGRGYARWTDLPSAPVRIDYTVSELLEVLAGRML